MSTDVTFLAEKVFFIHQVKKLHKKVTSGRVTGGGLELMDDGLPDPLKAMGKILMDNIDTDPKLALDAAYKLAQFTYYRKWNAGKKAAKNR